MIEGLENEDWKLRLQFEWVPKIQKIECPVCYGYGQVGGGPLCISDAETCPECRGHGIIIIKPDLNSKVPSIPVELERRLTEVWDEYIKEQRGIIENESEKR